MVDSRVFVPEASRPDSWKHVCRPLAEWAAELIASADRLRWPLSATVGRHNSLGILMVELVRARG